MHTFAGIASESLPEIGHAALEAALAPDPSCAVCQKAFFCARKGPDGNAPLSVSGDGRGKVMTLFSGRLDNGPELKSMLEKSGYAPRGDAPEELLIGLYEKYGSDAFCRLRGSFAAAIYDTFKDRLLLGRDVLGAEELYYFLHRGAAAFSNELGVLETHPLMPDQLDVNAIGTFLSLQYIPAPDTVYRGVRKLPPGHLLEMRMESGNASIRCFGKLDFSVKRGNLSFAEARTELREMLDDEVTGELDKRGGEVGLFLSGGIDSTIIAALAANRAGKRQIDVFTVGFPDPAYDERAAAKESVEFINSRTNGRLRHHVLELGVPTLELAENLARRHAEPYADVSVLPTYLLCKFASETVASALGGDGGDEFFAGYERYGAMRIAGMFDLLPARLRKGVFSALCKLAPDSGERTVGGRARRMLKLLGDPSREAYFNLLDRCPAEVKKTLFASKLRDALWHDGAEVFQHLEWELTAENPTESFSELDIRTYLPGDGCAKLAIASSAAGIEVATPFLSCSVAEFSARLPFEYKMSGNCRKRILKAAFADLLPPGLSKRRKRGFGSPMAKWFRGEWRAGAEKQLFDSVLCSGGFIDGANLRRYWEEHQSGRADWSYLFWSLLNLEWFLRRRKF